VENSIYINIRQQKYNPAGNIFGNIVFTSIQVVQGRNVFISKTVFTSTSDGAFSLKRNNPLHKGESIYIYFKN